jgi:hypothetical protein
MFRFRILGPLCAALVLAAGFTITTTDRAEAAYYGWRGGGAWRGGFARPAYGWGYRPYGRYYGYRGGWWPGAAVGAGLVGLTAGALLAGAPYGDPYYGGYYGYPAVGADQCWYEWRRVWVAGRGWRSVRQTVCGY